ncbi:MAG: helix-turn-helix domain-containing protein [Ruminococcus sp.]|nr:helix-turn-helix domain-containing protein [Ruminococcus sp.]MBR1752869.1 helix-turn-helix domain-containing protein [Ruminococcus sp.]
MLEIGERIRQCRERIGMTQDELAQATGYKSRSSINKIEKGGNDLPQSKIVIFAKALSTTPSYLMGWEDDDKKVDDQLSFVNINRQIPIFESVSAGFGTSANDYILGYMPLYIHSDLEADNTIAIKVSGNSMYPKIEDGDIIVVHKQYEVENKKIAVIRIDDDYFVKQFVKESNKVILHSLNPEYQDREFVGEQMNRVEIVGVVKQIIKEA